MTHDELWYAWNNLYVTTTCNATTVSYTATGDPWVVDPWHWTTAGTGTSSTYSVTLSTANWVSCNTAYEETREERRRRGFARLMHIARNQGVQLDREALDLSVISLSSRGREVADSLTPDELRQLQDEFQRAREFRLEEERRHEIRTAEQEAALRRAELLLLSLLDHAQKEEWLEHRRVTEVAPSGRVWRLFPVWSGGVALMNGDVRRATLCVHPRERVPEPDAMAAIILALRSGEENRVINLAILHAGEWTEEEKEIRRLGVGEKIVNLYDADLGGQIRVVA